MMESKTVEIQEDLLREKAIEAAKKHKASWIELGQYLFSIYKDKHYRTWGYLSFEAYCIKDLNMKQTTASKLLKSYSFLEKEEPRLVSGRLEKDESPKAVPNYEAVNLLRLARDNKNITPQEYAGLREAVLEDGKEPKEIRSQVQKILETKEDKDPEDVNRQKRNSSIRRLVTMLQTVKREFENAKLLPGFLLKQIGELAQKLEDQLE